MSTDTTTPRRRKGEGSITRFHNHPTCPPVGDDGVRPDHDCRGKYRAQAWVINAKGKRTRKAVYGNTEREVVEKLKKLHAAEQQGAIVDGAMTVRDWLRTDAEDHGIENWWTGAAPALKVNTRTTYSSSINRYLIPHLGNIKLTKLTPEHVEAMNRTMRKEGLSEATLLVAHHILSRALTVAARKGKVNRNVCSLIENRPNVVGRKPTPALNVEEAWKVLRCAGDNPRYWLALYAGLRQGEALGLRWSDLYLDGIDGDATPFLVVRRTVVRVPGEGLGTNSPKSEASTDRIVPLLPMVAARLRVLRATEFADGAVEEDYLFHSSRSRQRPLDLKRDWSTWKALLVVAGVREVTLHSARNTCAKLLEQAGVPDRVVAEILGHGAVHMTHRYQRDNITAKVEAMRELAAYLSTTAPPELSEGAA